MKTQLTLALIGALGVLAGGTAFAQPAPGEDAPPGRPLGRPDPETHRQMLLEKYDANQDGKLDDQEFAALGRDVFEGKLPPPRRGPGGSGFGPREPGGPGFAAPEPRGRRGEGAFGSQGSPRGVPPGPPPGPRMERGGFAPPNPEARRDMLEQHRREFIKRYDVNNDGKLDAAEREAIGRDIEEGKLPPPPPPPRGRGEAPPTN